MDLPIIAHVYPLTGISAKPFPYAGIGPSQTDGLVNRKRGLETRYQHLYLKINDCDGLGGTRGRCQ